MPKPKRKGSGTGAGTKGAYKHIIFDFGGVFLDMGGKHSRVPDDLSRLLRISDKKASDFWDEHKHRLFTGRHTSREFLLLASKKFGITIDIDEAYRLWKSYYKVKKWQIDWELLKYAKRLKRNHRLHMLTDTIDLVDGQTGQGWVDRVHGHFETVLKSHEQGLSKGDRRAFLNMLKKIGARPEECVFIDDFRQNIDVAESLGIRSILFTSTDALKEELSKLGIE